MFIKHVLAEKKCIMLWGCVWKHEGKKPFLKPGNKWEKEIQNMAVDPSFPYSSDLGPSNICLLLRML
jgi:hypothetical protein